eukprot:COSAG02_NODE_66748_length_254_cov_1.322581_1_plen_28_part_10
MCVILNRPEMTLFIIARESGVGIANQSK